MFSRAFAGELPEGAAKGFKARMEAWRAMTDEQRSAECERIERLQKAQREADAELRTRARRDRLRTLSGIGSRFAGALLTDLDWQGNEPARTAAMQALSTRSGWFFGQVGAGKTHIAAAIIADAINHDREAILISGLMMLSRIKSSYDDAGLVKPECVDVIGRLSKAPVLALDDLGKERFTSWAAEQFMLLIDARYRAKLPLLVTSNFAPRELERHWAANGMDAAYGPALVRRIVSMTGSPVQMHARRGAA